MHACAGEIKILKKLKNMKNQKLIIILKLSRRLERLFN